MNSLWFLSNTSGYGGRLFKKIFLLTLRLCVDAVKLGAMFLHSQGILGTEAYCVEY